MRPKPPSSPKPPRAGSPTQPDPGPSRFRPDADLPLLHLTPSTGTIRPAGLPNPTPGDLADGGPPRIEISDLPSVQPESSSGLSSYLLNPALLRNMGAADFFGIRYVNGRGFVDIKDTGTVHVQFDITHGGYRVMDLYHKLPPGPVLVRNSADATWGLAPQVESANPLKRPLPVVDDSDAQVLDKQPRTSLVSVPEATSRLFDDLLIAVYPQMTHGQRVEQLRSFNLSPGQHVRLHDDLIAHPAVIPQWAEQHRSRSQDANDPTRFDQMQKEIEPLLLPVRNGTLRSDLVDFDRSVSRDFLDAFLARLGYLRNSNHCLYRTDIPALFRADERTPFEFYNDGRMLPRLKHPRGATTAKPISATVSLKLIRDVYSGKGVESPDPEYLRYNNQKNRYPGKKPGESDNHSAASEDGWTDASDVELDYERNYETIRHDQQFVFSYIIDTRKMEVVLNEENHLLNLAALDNGAWFPDDELEALISTSKRGLDSERLWLLDSTSTRAARVDDIASQGQSNYIGNDIEARTHSGVYNRREYDALIDAVAAAGNPILTLPAGKDLFANDIVWPE